MYSPTELLGVTAFLVVWAICVRRAVRREGGHVLWIAWIPPGILGAFYGIGLLMSLGGG